MKKSRFFSFKTREGCFRLMWLLIAVILLSSFCARMVTTDGGSVKFEQVTIDARGAALEAELSYPAYTSDQDSLPAVILTHGGGCTYETTKNIAQELSRRGFVVLNVSGYGSGTSEQPVYDEGGSGPDYFDLNSPAGLYDALNFVRTLKFVDQTRIGMAGHSTGSKRVGSTAVIDNGFLSFNDIMVNILHDTFGQEFTAEEIDTNADELAAARLNADQLEYYNALRDAEWEEFNTRLRAICLFGSEGAMIVPVQTVTVAGHEVVRNSPVNLAIVNGTYDFSYYDLPRRDTTKAAFHTGDADIVLENWYAIDDVNDTSEMLGELTEISVADNAALAEAIENRATRLIVNNPETHSKNFLSIQTTADIVKYFEQTLGYNCGNLSDASTQPLDVGSQTWYFRIAFNLIAMLAMLLMMLPVLGLLLSRKFFAGCAVTVAPESRPKLNKPLYWILSVFTVAVGFYAMYNANKNGIFAYDPGPFLNLTRTACLTLEFLKWVCIGAGVVLVVGMIYNKKASNTLGLRQLNIAMNIKSILKCLLIGVIMVGAGYATLMVVDYLFNEQYRFWMTSFGIMKADYWFIVLKYALVLFPIYFVIGAAVNYTKRTDIPEWRDTLITVVVNSLGVWLLCFINIARAWFAYDGTLLSNFACSYEFLFQVPLVIYFSRKLYNKTGSLWVGAAFNTLLIGWAMTSTLGIHDIYVGQSWLGNFLGL